MRERKIKIFCIEAAILMIAITILPAVSADEIFLNRNIVLPPPIGPGIHVNQNPVQGEDQISEEGEPQELPYWLDGTILDGIHKVIITDDGQPPHCRIPESNEYIISYEEAVQIEEDARQAYIDTYGIDPCPPEPEEIYQGDDPANYYNMYIQYQEQYGDQNTSDMIMQGGDHPHADPGGHMYAGIFPACNPRDRPNDPLKCYEYTKTGWERFQGFNNLDTLSGYYLGCWDASDVPTNSEIYAYYGDLVEDLSDYWLEDTYSTFLVGWIEDAPGDAGTGWNYACAMQVRCMVNKPILVQHEISHILTAEDHYWRFLPPCVMGYFWYLIGYSGWCDSCRTTINDAIWEI